MKKILLTTFLLLQSLLLLGTLEGRAQVADGVYSIIAIHSGKCMVVSGGATDDDAPIIQYSCVRGSNQWWTVKRSPDGTYTITAMHSGKALDVAGANNADGAKVVQWIPANADNQRFNIVSAGDGYYQIIAVHSNKALTVLAGGMQDSAPIVQYTQGSGGNQKFKFDPVTKSHASAGDFYMIFASDTQYPRTQADDDDRANSERLNRDHARSMQAVAAQVGPSNLKGVIINGDLTEYGHDWQFAKYREVYDGLGLKIYPGLGNHDYANNVNDCAENNCANRMVTYMNDYVKGLKPTSYDFRESDVHYKFPSLRKVYEGSLAYSWDIGNVHFVQLHNYPAYAASWNGWNAGAARRDFFEIKSSMNWLRKDLADARNQGKAIILNMHDGGDHFIGEHRAEYDEFIKMIDEFKVSAVFAGHTHHQCGKVDWEGGVKPNVPLFRSGAAFYSNYLLVGFNSGEMLVEVVSSDGGKARRQTIGAFPLKTGRPSAPIVVPADGYIAFFNQGGYVARYSLSYTADGQRRHFDTGEIALGNQRRYDIPNNAASIKIKGEAKTGLLWEPWKVIFDTSVPGIPKKCYKSYGTTLEPKWNNSCQ